MTPFKKTLQGLCIITAAFFYFSCSRDIPAVANVVKGTADAATIQVFNATVKASRNYVYVDGTPVSGIAFAYGGVFPATSYSFKVPAGQRTILVKDTLPASTQTPITFSQLAEAGKSYTVFTYDTITSTKQLTVANNISVPTDTAAMLRFGNFIYNTAAVPAVDVYSFRKGNAAPVFANIATVQGYRFYPLPFRANGYAVCVCHRYYHTPADKTTCTQFNTQQKLYLGIQW